MTSWDRKDLQLEKWGDRASLIVISVPGTIAEIVYSSLIKSLPHSKLVRCTSPLMKEFSWIEIIPQNTSKAIAANWLKTYLKKESKVMAIGNDYNDLDMLDWADHSYVVDNAPERMKDKYKVVSAHDHNGFSEAVELYLSLGISSNQ